MPGTINGIGTWYYGKRNHRSEGGVCEFCGQSAQLQSYETRHWVVIFFVPIIPLGWKQIIGECPLCQRHRVISLKEWREIEQKTTREAIGQVDEAPDDPKSAVNFLDTLTGFGRLDEAADYAKVMGQQFGEDAEVQLYLGGWYTHFGRVEESKSHFANALALAPEDQQVRRAVIVSHVQQGDLERATQMLKSPQTELSKDDAELMMYFGDVFASRGEHQTALGYYDTALQWNESLHHNQQLGRRVRKSEKAVGCRTRRIPSKSFDKKPWLLLAMVAATVIFLLVGFNYYRKINRPLHVVNNLAVAAELDIDGEHLLVVPPGGHVETTVSEGSHKAVFKCEGKEDDEVAFAIDADFNQRIFDSAVYVLNVDGAADILYQRVLYSHPPREDGNSHRIMFGKKFLKIKGIDFVFTDPPDEIELPSGSNSCVKTAVSVLKCLPSEGFYCLAEGTGVEEQMRYAEHHLWRCPEDAGLMVAYWQLNLSGEHLDRCLRFLERGLQRKPVAVLWHRAYQNFCELSEKDDELVSKYDGFVRDERFQEPCEHSLFLYLRAMLEDQVPLAEGFLKASIEADSSNKYPLRAMANFKLRAGDYAQAKPFADEIRKLDAGEQPDSVLWLLRFALGEHEELLRETRAALVAAPEDYDLHADLLRVLMAMDRRDEAEAAHQLFVCVNEQPQQKTAGLAAPGDQFDDKTWATLYSKRIIYYLEGKLDSCLYCSKRMNEQVECPGVLASAYMAAGNSTEASKIIKSMEPGSRANFMLCLYLSWRENGNQSGAASAFEDALAELASEECGLVGLANILRQQMSPTIDEILDEDIDREATLLMLVVLADRFVQHRGEFLNKAEKINLPLDFPYHLIDRTIKRLRKQRAS